MEYQEYFDNLTEIEIKWRELKKENFPQKLRDNFWGLCLKGRTLFWPMAMEDKKMYGTMVSSVPAYERAVMLLEFEKRYKDAIRLCEEANKWEINTDWYNNSEVD
jgi:hypothetical protein